MFKKILEKLATYTEANTIFGGDLEETLCAVVDESDVKPFCGAGVLKKAVRKAVVLEAIRCCYHLGIIEALGGEQEGEVVVDWRLAQQILNIITKREVQRHKRCKTCEKPLSQDCVKMRTIEPTGRVDLGNGIMADVWDLWAFCSTCAAEAGPEWKR